MAEPVYRYGFHLTAGPYVSYFSTQRRWQAALYHRVMVWFGWEGLLWKIPMYRQSDGRLTYTPQP